MKENLSQYMHWSALGLLGQSERFHTHFHVHMLDLGPVQTSCFCRAELNSGIKFDKSTAEARRLNQTFELGSASN